MTDLRTVHQRAGISRLELAVTTGQMNRHGVVRGAVIYAMAETGMAAALYSTLAEGENCATIEIKVNYFKPIAEGSRSYVTELVNRGKPIANLESKIYLG